METSINPRRHAALLLFLLLVSSAAAAVSAGMHVVGDKKHWAPDVNYTEWAAGEHFYLHDWLVFYYPEGYYNVIQVNETNYERCSEENPINKYAKGRSYAMQLNETGRYYFISGGGYCWNGMELSINVEPLPAPAPAPVPPSKSSAARRSGIWSAAAVVGFAAFVLGV
ncbi:lamin-like protein [Phoenix dactylifera]|uniref:Lamin-like protein n=1 Tax=Phoenix dactylifera TaxID=42345 RepID=A0A8B7C8R4_PHODC|nr:lamin-like protein [Phoenix dactylifera]